MVFFFFPLTEGANKVRGAQAAEVTSPPRQDRSDGED